MFTTVLTHLTLETRTFIIINFHTFIHNPEKDILPIKNKMIMHFHISVAMRLYQCYETYGS